MLRFTRLAGSILSLLALCYSLSAQTPAAKEPAAADKNAVAVTVNGHAIYEAAVQRSLQRVPPEERANARAEVIQFLIDNAVIDQYLEALKVTVEAKEVDSRITEFKEELKQQKQDYAAILKGYNLTEAEFKDQIHNQVRWEKFVAQQATDEKLKGLFNSMPEAFDGTQVSARHILLPVGDEKAKEESVAKLQQIKEKIDKDVTAGLAKLPADADNLTKEKKKHELTDEAFADAARKNSTCPSKTGGGSLGTFSRFGSMVEPFAKAAFALKVGEISAVVTTQFGYHLILVTGRKQGAKVKFEDDKVKDSVKDVYEIRLKEAVLAQMRPRAKIEIKK